MPLLNHPVTPGGSNSATLLRTGEYVQAQVPFAAGAVSGIESWPVPVASVVRQGDKA